MTIRIPPKADIELRNALLDVEERLRALEEKNFQGNAETPSAEQESGDLDLEVDGDLIVANDLRVEGNIDATHLYEGLIKVVPAGEAGTSIAQRTMNLSSSLAIAPGGLSADSVRTRSLRHQPVGAHLKLDSDFNITEASATDITWSGVNWDSGGHWDSSAPTRITIQESGLYLMVTNVRWENQNNAGAYTWVKIHKNSTNDPNVQGLQVNQDNSPGWSTTNLTQVNWLKAGDYITTNAYYYKDGTGTSTRYVESEFSNFTAIRIGGL